MAEKGNVERKELAPTRQSSSQIEPVSTHFEPPKGTCRVFVGTKQCKGLPKRVTKHHLTEHFTSFSSDIINVRIERGVNSRFGIVTFTSRAVAEKAIQELDGSMLLEEFSLYLNFFCEKRSLLVTSSAAPKKPSQTGSITCTETKVATSSSTSIPLKSNVPPTSKKLHAKPNSRRRRRRKNRSKSASSAPDDGSSPKDHTCKSPVESPLVLSDSSILESSSQLSLSPACSPTLETASSEPSCPAGSSPAILIKSLSLLVTEEEIKALLVRYGFEMMSCKLYTDTEAIEPDLNTTTALVHMKECCNVSEAVTVLDGLKILGECIHVVPFQASDVKSPTTHSLTVHANLSSAQAGLGSEVKTQNNSCSKADGELDASEVLTAQGKCKSPNSVTVPQPSTTPVMLGAELVLCISDHQYNFFVKQFPEDVEQFRERGGKVSYRKGQMIAQAPSRDILDKFISDVGKTGEVKQYLSPDQWKCVQIANSEDDSYFAELKAVLGSDLSAEVHFSLNEPQVLLVVGVLDELVKAGNRLDDFLKDLPLTCLNIEALQMKALICTLPNLTENIFQQYKVRVSGFNARSTYLILRGPPAVISQARADILAKVSSVLLKQVEFPYPQILTRSVQKRINKIHAFLLLLDGEENASTTLLLKVHICSLINDSLEDASQVIKDGPFEKQVVLASSSPKVATVSVELQNEVAVVIKVQESSESSTSLLIQGYVLEDVTLASEKLAKEFNPITHPLRLTSHHRAYLKALLDSTQQQGEGEKLYHSLCDIAVRVEFKSEAGVCLVGVEQAVESAVDQILSVLHGLHNHEFLYTCDLCFSEQIKQKVLIPIQAENKDVFYCVEKTPKRKAAAGSTPVTFTISIFSKNSKSLKKSCETMMAICPYSSSHSIHPDALTLKKKSLNKVARKHDAQVELVSDPIPLLRIHALCEKNAVSCWADMDKFIASAIKTTKEVQVSVYKAEYIQFKHAEEIAEFGKQCDIQLPQLGHKKYSATSLSIRITGNIGIVSKACKRIKEVSEQCKVEKVTLQCPLKYLSMWRKRWEEFKEEQEEQYDVMIEINCQPLSRSRRGSDQPRPDDTTPSSATFVVYGDDHEGIKATIQLLLEKENGKLLAECVFELGERKQIILLTGLKNKELDPRTKYSIYMDIDKDTRCVKLIAPLSWESHLMDAKEEILQFIGGQTQVKYEFICDDHVVGLVLTSRSFQFCSQLLKFAKDSDISIQPFRKPRPGFKLWGLETSIEEFKSKAMDLISSHVRPMISSQQLQVHTLEVTALSSDEFHHLESRLQEQLCVVCKYPNKGEGKNGVSDESELSDQEDASPPLLEGKGKHWFWMNDSGQFIPYPSEVSDALTTVHSQCSTGKYNWLCPENGSQYVIDLSRMEQRNIATGVARKVSLQPAKYHWSCLDKYGENQPYNDMLSDQLERSFRQGKDRYISGIHFFDLKLMVMMKPTESPMMREIKAIPAHVPQDKKEKKPKDVAGPKRITIVIRGPKRNLKQAQSQIRRELDKAIITKDLDLPSHATIDFEQNLKSIANNRRGISISICSKYSGAASSTQAKVIRIKGLQQSVDAVVIKIQDEIIKFHSSKSHSLKASEPQDTPPPEWEAQDRTVQLFPVQYNSSEWRHVTGLFKQTLPAATVLSVKRIQNTWLWKKYVHHRAMLHQKNAGSVNEKELFHGTRDTDPEKIFDSEEGFDMRFSREGLWGQANYFAVNSSYSDAFAHTRHSGEKEILLAKVLTGISVQCQSDQTLRMPPLNTASGGIGLQQQRYDTVCGTTQGSVVYMTYSNDKAYPAYLIRYTDKVDYHHHSGYHRTQPASQYAYSSASLQQHISSSQPRTSSSHSSIPSSHPSPLSQPSQATRTQSQSSQATGAQFRPSQATSGQSQGTGRPQKSSSEKNCVIL